MRFAQVNILYFLWAIVLVALFLLWAWRRRQRLLRHFAESQLIDEIAPGRNQKRCKQKNYLLILVFILSILALARPQWGFEWREVKREALDILVVIDTSRSMLTQDVKPNRLERTKLAVKDLIKKLQGDRIGLIAFAGDAFLVCPLTIDYSGFLLSLDDLDPETIPRGGTNLSAALQEAIKGYDDTSSQYKAVVILTDGENLEADPLPIAKKAKSLGIKIYSIGVGTKEGELVRVPNILGEQEFLKDENGNFVKSRLNEKLLQEIALLTGGIYVRASGAQFGLDLILEKELSQFKRREIESRMERKYFERFQLPLGLALLFLVFETCLTTRKKRLDT